MNQKIKELIGNVAGLVYEINATTEYAVWMDIVGHVSRLNVNIAKSKKEYDVKIAESNFNSYRTSDYRSEKEIINRLTAIQNNLQSILDNGIELEQVGTEEIRTVPTYRKVTL